MTKKSIYIVLFIMLFTVCILSLYTTFAYDEEAKKLDESTANYNLIYSLKDASNKQITVASKETKYVDIKLNNAYNSTVKYGMYYRLLKPNKMPDNINISLSEDSVGLLQDTIKSGESKVVSIKIDNNSEYNIELIIGALVGFENGNIEELLKENEVIIK